MHKLSKQLMSCISLPDTHGFQARFHVPTAMAAPHMEGRRSKRLSSAVQCVNVCLLRGGHHKVGLACIYTRNLCSNNNQQYCSRIALMLNAKRCTSGSRQTHFSKQQRLVVISRSSTMQSASSETASTSKTAKIGLLGVGLMGT